MNEMKKVGLAVALSISMSSLSGCAAMMTGMEFLAEIGECAAGVDCVQDRGGFDGVQSDDGMSAIAAGTRPMPSYASGSDSSTRSSSKKPCKGAACKCPRTAKACQ